MLSSLLALKVFAPYVMHLFDLLSENMDSPSRRLLRGVPLFNILI